MEVRVGTLLVGLDRKPLRHPKTNEPWTVGLVLIEAALSAPPTDTTYSESEHVARWQIAVALRDGLELMQSGKLDALVDVTDEMIVLLKADIMRSFGPIVGGQISPILKVDSGTG